MTNIEDDTMKNKDFRRVFYTEKIHSGFNEPSTKEEIGLETHAVDQFSRVEAANGVAILDGVEHQIPHETAVAIPASTTHNIINNPEREELKLYALYSPPEHRDQKTRKPKPMRLRANNTLTARRPNSSVPPGEAEISLG